MKIRRPRSLTNFQIALATVLGVLGGYYIWKPVFAPRSSIAKPIEQNR